MVRSSLIGISFFFTIFAHGADAPQMALQPPELDGKVKTHAQLVNQLQGRLNSMEQNVRGCSPMLGGQLVQKIQEARYQLDVHMDAVKKTVAQAKGQFASIGKNFKVKDTTAMVGAEKDLQNGIVLPTKKAVASAQAQLNEQLKGLGEADRQLRENDGKIRYLFEGQSAPCVTGMQAYMNARKEYVALPEKLKDVSKALAGQEALASAHAKAVAAQLGGRTIAAATK